MLSLNKTIRDPVHGDIKIDGMFLELIEAPEIQRLYNIKQLGFANLVFPGAHHTRLEHSLGAFYISSKAAEKLDLDEKQSKIISCASMLHDIGHGPFSHTLESILRETLNVDHVDLTEKLIYGENSIFEPEEKQFIGSASVVDLLEKYEINKSELVDIIRGKKKKDVYLSQLLNSSIDVDQLDYLVRDSYYTGVAYGMIDTERFLQTLTIDNGKLAVKKKGIGVVENILMARTLMYSSVYFHKTVRIAEIMLSKAIELIDKKEPFEFFKMTDVELINKLKEKGKFQNEIATRLKYRRLFKQVYSEQDINLNNDEKKILKKLENNVLRRKKEEEIEEKLKIPRGHVIIDIPYKEIHQAEPRIDNTDIVIIDNDKRELLDKYTPIAKAIRLRHIPDWTIMIVSDEKYRDILSEKSREILFS